MPRLSIEIQGVVQGVGFRPFVYRLAQDRKLEGWVRNKPEGVEIEVQGAGAVLAAFQRALETEAPGPARIHSLVCREVTERSEEPGFSIRPSASVEGGATRPSLPADLAICPDCLKEIRDPHERRHGYPFTNCTRCGPRYTLLASLPYDRPRTTMAAFLLCEACRAQYEDPADRRFHAQPIACPTCGPRLTLVDVSGQPMAEASMALERAASLLESGGILALKGLGGFQLLVDATSECAVALLRQRKRRETKPFAVMFPDLDSLQAHGQVDAEAARLLASSASPIVLLRRRADGPRPELASGIAPGNPDLGCFLPNTPLHQLLVDRLARPVVCTSGNLSEEPMAIEDGDALARLGGIADAFLLHDRPILRPMDDSVARIEGGVPRLLRRARGYAPLPMPVSMPEALVPILALGGHQKSTITVQGLGQAVTSQHLGDLDSPLGRALLARTTADLLDFLKVQPTRLACDLHPDYASTRWAESLAQEWRLPLVRVQHHHAHIAACLAELALDEPVLGLAWDGSGYGSDGVLWGGEALRVEGAQFTRLGHLREFPLPGGERAIREPRRSALGLCWECLGPGFDTASGAIPELEAHFAPGEWNTLQAMLARGFACPRTTSIGRLFDAAAALTGVHATSGFEGQAAMALEFAARAESPGDAHDGGHGGAYVIALKDGIADPAPMLSELLSDRRRGASPGVMARRFHGALADLAVAFAESEGLPRVVLSGGCFQNALLAGMCEEKLAAAGFQVHRPALLPCNDGGLSLGQAWVAAKSEV